MPTTYKTEQIRRCLADLAEALAAGNTDRAGLEESAALISGATRAQVAEIIAAQYTTQAAMSEYRERLAQAGSRKRHGFEEIPDRTQAAGRDPFPDPRAGRPAEDRPMPDRRRCRYRYKGRRLS